MDSRSRVTLLTPGYTGPLPGYTPVHARYAGLLLAALTLRLVELSVTGLISYRPELRLKPHRFW